MEVEMSEKPPRKTTIYDFFIKIVEALKLQDLPKYAKFNLLSTAMVAVVALALAIPPVLVLVNNIVISIGSVFIAAAGRTEHIQVVSTSVILTLILPLCVVCFESIVCLILCYFYQKINDVPADKP